MTLVSKKKIISQKWAFDTASADARITVLEDNEYKITYYEVISGASGSVTLPTGATINAGEFGLSGNAILSKIDGSDKPTYESPKTAGGVVVTASLNTSTGAWVASGTYTDSDVALIYSIKIKAVYYSNLNYDRIIDTVELTDFPISQVITNGVTNKVPSEDAVYDALSLKLTASNNLSDVSNPITARNNLKEWDLYLTNGDQSTTSNVASNVTDLVSTTLEINKRYKIEGFLHIGCSSTGGVKLQITIPTGATLWVDAYGYAATGTSFTRTSLTASATLSAVAFCTVSSVNGMARLTGEIVIDGTAGTIQIGFASGTNTQTSTIYQAGTIITIKQLN